MKRAIYPGSFDPITNGHIDIVNRALHVFDEVHIAVTINTKKTPLFSIEERQELIREVFQKNPNVYSHSFTGLLADFALLKNIQAVIRGLRVVSDFDYEWQMALTNRKLAHEQLDTVFFMTDAKFSYLSSSLVRQVSQYGGDIHSFVPDSVNQALNLKLNRKGKS